MEEFWTSEKRLEIIFKLSSRLRNITANAFKVEQQIRLTDAILLVSIKDENFLNANKEQILNLAGV